MSDEEVRRIIEETANAIVIKLKRENLIHKTLSSYKKTEKLLWSYPSLKMAVENDESEKAKALIQKIDVALESVKDNPYHEIISLYYFKKVRIEIIADELSCDISTIARNKSKMIEKMKTILFSEEAIQEILL